MAVLLFSLLELVLLFLCMVVAFFVLAHAFVVNDFTVAYVAGNSKRSCRYGIARPPPKVL